MGDLEGLRSVFLKLYASVPDKLRDEIIAVVNGKTYSWNAAFFEVNGNTPLGKDIIRKLEEIGLLEDKK